MIAFYSFFVGVLFSVTTTYVANEMGGLGGGYRKSRKGRARMKGLGLNGEKITIKRGAVAPTPSVHLCASPEAVFFSIFSFELKHVLN